MDHQNSNSSNTAARFARPMESGDNVDRTNGNTFSLSSSCLFGSLYNYLPEM